MATVGLILLAVGLPASGCTGGLAGSTEPASFTEQDEVLDLWHRTITPRLLSPLWTDAEAYNAGHFLMVPLHAAFELGMAEQQREFSAHFGRFAQQWFGTPMNDAVRLARLQYLYLASEFVVLADTAQIPAGLVDSLYEIVHRVWTVEPIWQWDRAPMAGAMRERVTWKLAASAVKRSYYRAITDDELFLFAIAADLRTRELRTGDVHPRSSTVRDVLLAAKAVFDQRAILQPAGGWLFQPGAWADHPDFAYAGRYVKVPGMAPAPVSDVAEDASHSHRMPLWLTSLARAYPPDRPERRFYEDLRRGLEKQFYEKVLVPPSRDFPAYRTTNFMDGRNGIYRWGYVSLGPNDGYGPYELSGTLQLGWWAFLRSDRIQRAYQEMARQFPLPPDVWDLYLHRRTTAPPLGSGSAADLGAYALRELLVRLAARLRIEGKP
jgi:hypothetical protein